MPLCVGCGAESTGEGSDCPSCGTPMAAQDLTWIDRILADTEPAAPMEVAEDAPAPSAAGRTLARAEAAAAAIVRHRVVVTGVVFVLLLVLSGAYVWWGVIVHHEDLAHTEYTLGQGRRDSVGLLNPHRPDLEFVLEPERGRPIMVCIFGSDAPMGSEWALRERIPCDVSYPEVSSRTVGAVSLSTRYITIGIQCVDPEGPCEGSIRWRVQKAPPIGL